MSDILWKDVESFSEAASESEKEDTGSKFSAGATDIAGVIKNKLCSSEPFDTVINLAGIEDGSTIHEGKRGISIGALVKLEDLAKNDIVRQKYTALSEAAAHTASDHLRKKGTIAGNLCQENRCWYFRAGGNKYECLRKGGHYCYAIEGENQFHSIFGAERVEGLPCRSDCPSKIDIPDYMAKLRNNDIAGAAEILLENNPLAAMTGRVCPHFCEENCNRCATDDAVSIREVERYVGDYILENAAKLIKIPSEGSGKKAAVIGGGPAGLSAAYYLRKQGHQVTVFEKQKEAGGMLRYAIPGYRLPKNIVRKQIQIFEQMGIEFKTGVSVGKDADLVDIMNEFDAVVLAAGSWKGLPTGIEGENNFLSGLQLLKEINEGRKELPGKKIAVLGGGNTAMDVVRTLKRMGADVCIIYRRTRIEMPAISNDVDKAIEESIEFKYLTQPIMAKKKEDGTIDLTCSKMKLGEPDESGRRRPVLVPNSAFTDNYDAVVTAFGEVPDTDFLPLNYLANKDRLNVRDGYIGDNLFGGGDFITGASTVTEAMASGKAAAKAVGRYLGVFARSQKICIGLPRMDEKTPRTKIPEMTPEERAGNLSGEDTRTLCEEEAVREANRCLNCSCIAVNCSDIAPALIAFNAVIVTNQRRIAAERFFAVKVPGSTVLERVR